MVVTNLSSGAKGKSLLSIVIKLLMNYLQTAALMKAFLVCAHLFHVHNEQVKVKGLVNDMLDKQEQASGPSTQFISFSCAVNLDQYGLFVMWMALPAAVFLLPGIVAIISYIRRALVKERLMSQLLVTRDRRYSIGFEAENEEQRIAVLHAVHTGLPIPNFEDAERKASREVSETCSNELVADLETANQITGEGLGFRAALNEATKEEAQGQKDNEARKNLKQKAKELKRAARLAEEDLEHIFKLLESENPLDKEEAARLVESAATAEAEMNAQQLDKDIRKVEDSAADGPMQAPPELQWDQKISKTYNKAYWKHRVTGESCWQKPLEVVNYEAEAAKAESASINNQESSEKFSLLIDDSGVRNIAARRRWAHVRQVVMEGIRSKREEKRKKELVATKWQGLAMPLSASDDLKMFMIKCSVCEADYGSLMCKDCGSAARDEFRRKKLDRRERLKAGDFDDIREMLPDKKTFVEHNNGHAYFYVCQFCDKVVHASGGPNARHLRLRVRTEEDNDEGLTDKDIDKIKRKENTARPEVVYTVTVLVVVFLAYPRLMTEIATLMKCIDLPTTGKSFLESDLRIECSDKKYDTWKSVAVIFFFVYGFGIPIFGFLMLSAWAGKDGSGLLRKKVVESFGFLYSGFRMNRYYWEMVIMFRKMLVVFILVFYDGKEQYQSMLGTWLMTFFLLVNIFAKPFMFHVLWRIENLSLACIAVSLNLAMLYEKKYKIEQGSAEESAVTMCIFLLNMCTMAAFVYCIFKAAKIQFIDMFDDPNDPDGALTWEEVKSVARVKLYRTWAPRLAFFGITIRNPEEQLEKEAEDAQDEIRIPQSTGENPMAPPRRVSLSTGDPVEDVRRRSSHIDTMPPQMVKVLGYNDKYPDLFDEDGKRRSIKENSPAQGSQSDAIAI